MEPSRSAADDEDVDLESVAAAFDPDTEIWDCFLMSPPDRTKRYLLLIPADGQRSGHSVMQRIEPEEMDDPSLIRFRPGATGRTDRAVADRRWFSRAAANGWVTVNRTWLRARFSGWDELMAAAVTKLTSTSR